MAFKNIMLAYCGEAAFESSLDQAIKLTQYYDGWLTGVMRNGRPFTDQYRLGLNSDLMKKLDDVQNEDVFAAVEKFDMAVKAAGLQDRAEFLRPADLGDLKPSELARSYDLVVTGFKSELAFEEHHTSSPNAIALWSGRPVLVVPPEYKAPSLVGHALLAWDGKRSAARALGEAMTVLEDKGKVTVLTIGRKAPKTPVGGGIMRHLERHGIEANHVHKTTSGKSIAAKIEDTADELGVKLIIMGAYEHSKFSQDLLGGVTNEVLKTARVPVFMSH